MHEEIVDFLKSWSDYLIKCDTIYKPMVLFIIGEKNDENPLMQTKDIFYLVRLCIFQPAQGNFQVKHLLVFQ